MGRRHEAAIGECIGVVKSMSNGAMSFFLGLALVARTVISPGMLAEGKLLRELRFTPVVTLWVLLISSWMWIMCWPLKYWGLIDPEWKDFVRASALIALAAMRQFLPGIAPDWFFYVLATHDKALAGRIQQQPIIFGLREKAKRWFLASLGCVLALAACIALAPVAGPALAAAVAVVLAAGHIVVVVVLVVLVVVLFLGGSAYLYGLVRPLLKLLQFDPILGWIVILTVALRFLSAASIGTTLRTATVLYYSCTLLTSQLLVQYGERLQQVEWESFQRKHCWRMFGFGLPIWVLVQYAPITVVVFLQVFQGASARLLADILETRGSD